MPWVAQCTVNARPVAWRRTQNEAAKVCTAGRMARRSCIASRRARDCAWVDVTRQFCLPRVQTAAKSFQVHALVNQAWRRVDCKSLVAMLEASALRKEAGKAGDVLSYPNMCGWGGMGKPGLVFGFEELSSLNQHRIMLARQIAIKMLNAGMSEHPDMANLRTLGDQWYDPSSEPGRWTRYTVTTDNNQTQTEWVDMDMEMEMLLNNSYKAVKEILARNRWGI
eukprot:1157587-Pelagomonas_calceolata.AAC.12